MGFDHSDKLLLQWWSEKEIKKLVKLRDEVLLDKCVVPACVNFIIGQVTAHLFALVSYSQFFVFSRKCKCQCAVLDHINANVSFTISLMIIYLLIYLFIYL